MYLLKVCKIITVCGLLHNICKDRNIPAYLEDPPEAANAADRVPQQDLPPLPVRHRNAGRLYRDQFCNLYFK